MTRTIKATPIDLVDLDLPLIPGSVLYVGEVRRRENQRDCSFCGGSGVVGVEGEDGTRCTVDCPADCMEGQVYDGFRWEAYPRSLNVTQIEVSWEQGEANPNYRAYADRLWRNVSYTTFHTDTATRYFMTYSEAEDWAQGWAAAFNAQEDALAEDHRREADKVRLVPEPQPSPTDWIWCRDCGARHLFSQALWGGASCNVCHSGNGKYMRIAEHDDGTLDYSAVLRHYQDGEPLTGFPPPGLHIPELQEQGAD